MENKYCKDCKFFKQSWWDKLIGINQQCIHPKNLMVDFIYEMHGSYKSPYQLRNSSPECYFCWPNHIVELCGKEAKWFEPKS